MKIGVIGSGYVGLVTGACFAHLGNEVICVDNNQKKIQMLKKGIMPIYEPGLSEMVLENVKAKRMSFVTKVASIVNHCDILFICVNTPPLENGEADLSSVENVAKIIARNLKKYCLIVSKSTVPVETGAWIKETIKKYVRPKIKFDIASNPEFLREGTAIHDFLKPDRVVVGVSSKRAERLFSKLYQPLKAPLVVTDIKSAELIKHAANSFLATKISFTNVLARICDVVGADVEKVTYGMGLDPRIGARFLKAGIGFGGFCFPKDLSAFARISEKIGVGFNMLHEALNINAEQVDYFIHKIRKTLKTFKNKKIGVLGLAFKPGTDDLRFAPSIPIIRRLQEEGVSICAYDPQAMKGARDVFSDIKYGNNPYEVARKVDAIAILTEWNEFQNLDWKRMKKEMKHPLVFDGRNMFQPTDLKNNGFQYISMGRPS